MAENIDDVLVDEEATTAGVPTPASDQDGVKPLDDYQGEGSNEVAKTAETQPEVLDYMPSIKRQETLAVDDNFNFDYVLKNGKNLKTSVTKPDLAISTELSDNTVRINQNNDGSQYVTINNMSVYSLIMDKLIKVILVDKAPLHTVTFKSLSEIGMTKAELDDYMGIIATFYLE
ncbi:hypothetical protein [Lentilactobacillus sp. SPB1-3]|uniref:Uncharacterized protein n=1 Tax=Lentilactobacillus terminaliae TaxID=3003483 RepID=A0ACD5DCJ3_9LACO|nr:hypothetical protein [Lentilactobacillus sp. SPB1-3]MCZ0978093.1 hypothetical protein [Lentilactobacillus sp. SPB1-3]